MATEKCKKPQNVTHPVVNRRDLLKAGAAAAGMALLPRSAGDAPHDAAPANDYLAAITRVAEELRPRFESGEMYGFRDADDERMDVVMCERLGMTHDPEYRATLFDLEDIIGEKVLAFTPEFYGHCEEKPARRAAWVLMHSPSTPHVVQDAGETLIGMAKEAMTRDVLRIARQRRWYIATADECPSNEDLGLEGLPVAAASVVRAPVAAVAESGPTGLERIARRLDHDTGALWKAVEETQRASTEVTYAIAGVGASSSVHDVKKAAHELHMASGRLWEAASHVAEDKAAMA